MTKIKKANLITKNILMKKKTGIYDRLIELKKHFQRIKCWLKDTKNNMYIHIFILLVFKNFCLFFGTSKQFNYHRQ